MAEIYGGFSSGTLVHTRDGLKPIQDISINDWVLSYPHEQHTLTRLREESEYIYRRVAQTFVSDDRPLSKLIVSNLSEGTRDTLFLAANQPVYNSGKGWTPVSEMDAGDVVEQFSYA